MRFIPCAAHASLLLRQEDAAAPTPPHHQPQPQEQGLKQSQHDSVAFSPLSSSSSSPPPRLRAADSEDSDDDVELSEEDRKAMEDPDYKKLTSLVEKNNFGWVPKYPPSVINVYVADLGVRLEPGVLFDLPHISAYRLWVLACLLDHGVQRGVSAHRGYHPQATLRYSQTGTNGSKGAERGDGGRLSGG